MKINTSKQKLLTKDMLHKMMHYDPETGVFTWKVKGAPRIRIGDMAGNLASNGYRRITLNKAIYSSHRLAWLYMTGNWPKDCIDHINGIKDDNRLCNLREATHSDNMSNSSKPKSNTSGYKGVCWSKKDKKWTSTIKVRGKQVHLGSFDDPVKGYLAYCEASKKYFGAFSRVD